MSCSLKRWQNKVAVVTGASAGIGATIAQTLVEEGLQVVGLARKSDKVEEIAKKLSGATGKLYAYKANITNEEEVLNAFDWIVRNVGPVSVLVNNAGIGFAGTLIDGETQFWKQTLDTNVLALSVCTREAIKQMRNNGIDGQIIHIGSVPIYINSIFPSFNMWTPSKTAVSSLTEMLRQELNQIGSKIKVSVCFKHNVLSNIISFFNFRLLSLEL